MEKTQWDKLKDIYSNISVSEKVVNEQWNIIQQRLPSQDRGRNNFVLRYPVAFLAILLISLSLVRASQLSEPGDTLYSVKDFTTKISNDFFGTQALPTAEKKIDKLKKRPTNTPPPQSPTRNPSPTTTKEVKGVGVEAQKSSTEQRSMPAQSEKVDPPEKPKGEQKEEAKPQSENNSKDNRDDDEANGKGKNEGKGHSK